MSLRFDDRVVIVTGAGGSPSLGSSYAGLLARLGGRVVVNDLGVGPDGSGSTPADAERVASQLRASGLEAVSDTHSVSTEEGALGIVQTALDRWGRVDALINNAGVLRFGLLEELAAEDIQKMVDVHFYGTIWMSRAVWPHMREAGYGRIVNTTSPGMLGSGNGSIYGAVKAGIYGLTRTMAIEGESHGIRVNSLAPLAATIAWSVVQAPDKEAVGDDLADAMHPDKIAPVAALLAHQECLFSGKHINAEPGHVAETYYRQTTGFTSPDLTLDSLREHLDKVVDRSDSFEVGDPTENPIWVGGRAPGGPSGPPGPGPRVGAAS